MTRLFQITVLSVFLTISSPVLTAGEVGLSDGLAAYGDKDFKRARKLLHPLAESGVPEAQVVLARMYHSGCGVRQDIGKAFDWYEKAAQRGLSEAQFEIGLFYLDGVATTEDEYAAFEWLAKAAKQGHPNALVLYERLLNSEEPMGC